jgi:hypothetical protein
MSRVYNQPQYWEAVVLVIAARRTSERPLLLQLYPASFDPCWQQRILYLLLLLPAASLTSCGVPGGNSQPLLLLPLLLLLYAAFVALSCNLHAMQGLQSFSAAPATGSPPVVCQVGTGPSACGQPAEHSRHWWPGGLRAGLCRCAQDPSQTTCNIKSSTAQHAVGLRAGLCRCAQDPSQTTCKVQSKKTNSMM